MGIFKLNKEVSESSEDIDADDIINVKNGLKNLGYYKTPEYGITKFGDTPMFEGMRNFQKDHKLNVDGIMKPQGETETMLNKILRNGEYASSAAQQGLTFGWADEIEGVAGGAGYGVGSLNKKWNKTGETFGQAFKRGYVKTRDARRANLEEGYKRNPVLTGGVEMVSATINPLNKVVASVSKTAPLKIKNKQALNGAMRMGAIYGAGTGDGNLLRQVKNTSIGGMSSGIGHFASKGSDKITKALNSFLLRRGINESVNSGTSKIAESFLNNKKEDKR